MSWENRNPQIIDSLVFNRFEYTYSKNSSNLQTESRQNIHQSRSRSNHIQSLGGVQVQLRSSPKGSDKHPRYLFYQSRNVRLLQKASTASSLIYNRSSILKHLWSTWSSISNFHGVFFVFFVSKYLWKIRSLVWNSHGFLWSLCFETFVDSVSRYGVRGRTV